MRRTGTWLLLVLSWQLVALRGWADDFCLLDDDRQALQARVQLIESAQFEICLAYYAIDTGDVPIGLLELLRHAARRGVAVHVLADGLKSRLPSDLEKLFSQQGVQFRLFHAPYQGRPGTLNRRLHDKLMVVDRQAMIIGSRNLQDHHFGFDHPTYIDCDAYLSGDIASHAAAYFQQLWESSAVLPAEETNSLGIDLADNRRLGIPFGRSLSPRRVAAIDSASSGALARLNALLARPAGGDCFAELTYINDVQACLISDAEVGKSQRHVQRQIIDMLDSASSSLVIESPYPVFSAPIWDAFRRACRRGVDVTLLTNSLESSRVVLPYAAYHGQKRELLEMGMRLYEFVGPDHLHVKSMVVDHCRVMLGSYNFDERSDHLNLELCVRVDDPRVAASMTASTQRRLQLAQPVDGTGVRPAIGEEANAAKRLRLRLGQAVTPILRKSL